MPQKEGTESTHELLFFCVIKRHAFADCHSHNCISQIVWFSSSPLACDLYEASCGVLCRSLYVHLWMVEALQVSSHISQSA